MVHIKRGNQGAKTSQDRKEKRAERKKPVRDLEGAHKQTGAQLQSVYRECCLRVDHYLKHYTWICQSMCYFPHKRNTTKGVRSG